MVCWTYWSWATDKDGYQCLSTQSDHASAAWHMEQCKTQLINQSMHTRARSLCSCVVLHNRKQNLWQDRSYTARLFLSVWPQMHEEAFPAILAMTKKYSNTTRGSCRWKKNTQWGLGIYAWFLLALTIISHVTPVANPSGTHKTKYLLLAKMTVLKLAYMWRSGLQIA